MALDWQSMSVIESVGLTILFQALAPDLTLLDMARATLVQALDQIQAHHTLVEMLA